MTKENTARLRVSAARVARWVEEGNIASVRALPHTSYSAVLALDDLRLLLNRTYTIELRAKPLFKGNDLVKNVKQFCGELLDRCVPNHWKTTLRQAHACLTTRVSVASSLFSLRKLLPGKKPSVRDYVEKMNRPQQPPTKDFADFVVKEVESMFVTGWDRGYWRQVRSFTPPTKSNLDKKEKGTYRERAVRGDGDLSRDTFLRWAGGTVTTPVKSGVRATCVETSGKWRVITLSDPCLSNLLPLHKTIYNFLTKQKWLLRGEARPSCFNDFGRIKGEVFVSGDYEGATDNLNQHVSRLVLQTILRRGTHIPTRVREEAVAALAPYFLDKSFGLKSCQRGQLMGSPLSFPLLCLVNYLTFRYAIRREVPVKINGDDIVFRSTQLEADRWFELVGASGLVVSKGKTLLSRRFFSLNSTYFLAADRGASLIPHFRTSCLYRKCEDLGALAGRVAQIKRDLVAGGIRENALVVLLRENLKLIYSSQGSFSRRLCCPVPKIVLKRLRLDDRESFYRGLPSEPEVPSRFTGFRQQVLPESWTKEKVVKRGQRRVPEDELRDTLVSGSWTGPIISETKDDYFERVREKTFRYVAFSEKAKLLYRKCIGKLRSQVAKPVESFSVEFFQPGFHASQPRTYRCGLGWQLPATYTPTSYPPLPSSGEKFWVEKECEGPSGPVAFRSGGVMLGSIPKP